MRKWWVLKTCFIIFGLAGCGGTSALRPATLNSPLEGDEIKVQLESSGWVAVVQDFNHSGYRCERVSKHIRAEMLDLKEKKEVRFEKLCEDEKQRYILRSMIPLKNGEYSLRVRSNLPKEAKATSPQVVVEYVDPNFATGPEQVPMGASSLAKNATIQGIIDASKGVKTRWYQISGDGGSTQLGYLQEEGDTPLQIAIYRMTEDLKPKRLLAVLKPKKQEKFDLGPTPLYVRVDGPLFSREMKYSLFRKDLGSTAATNGTGGGGSTIVTPMNIPLIERYVLSPTSAVLVVRANDKLKPNTELNVFGKIKGQKLLELGKCTLTSISGGQGSCKLEGADLSQATQIKIVLNP